ncbi:MAG: glycosyltransferase [Gammaproteobacteria bacterium]
MKFLLETSRVPIYQRIIAGFSDALNRLGYEVLHINQAEFSRPADYLDAIQECRVDYCMITNTASYLSLCIDGAGKFLFELLKSRVIFIHHDGLGGGMSGFEEIKERLAAYVRMKDKSCHFCIEHYNYLDLRALGLESVYSLYHASEFTNQGRDVAGKYNVSFTGHVLPSEDIHFPDSTRSHYLYADFWGRVVQADHEIEPSAIEHALRRFPEKAYELDWFAEKYSYVTELNLKTQRYRGCIIERIHDVAVDIFGGDPGYLHGMSGARNIENPNIIYHPPTSDYTLTQSIYAASRINLNITSMQFDHAVINRVIDIASCGGFLLTDWKSDLRKLTTVCDEISYRSIDELNEKIEYYLTHERERLEIATQLHEDISSKCNYAAIMGAILCKINSRFNGSSEPLRLDIGCGPRKKEGFTGVDVDASWPGVDVEADLSKRLPFSDSSVEEIRAYDVIEHLPDRIHTMNELWRVCKHGAILDIRVPSTDGRGAFQDPTHVSFWNVNSFMYYSSDYPAYLELCRSYGFVGDFKIERCNEETSPGGVIHINIGLSVLKKS